MRSIRSAHCFGALVSVTSCAALVVDGVLTELETAPSDDQPVSLLQISSHKSAKGAQPQADAETDSELPGLQKFLDEWRSNEKSEHFPHAGDWMDSEESIEARLNSVLAAGRQDPCAAKMQVHCADGGIGLGTLVQYMYNEAFAGIYTGLPMAMRTDHGGYTNKLWSSIYSNAADMPICQQNTNFAPGHVAISWGFGMMLRRDLHSEENAVYEERMHRTLYVIGKKMLDYQPDVKTAIESRLSSLGVGDVVNYVGVHIRHGDKSTEDVLVPAKNFSDAIKKKPKKSMLSYSAVAQLARDALDRAGSRTVFVSTDDTNAASELRSFLGGDYHVIQQDPSDDAGHQDRSYDDKESTLSVLTDVQALANSAIFIGSATSGMSRLVFVLRDLNAESISLGTSANFLYPF